MGINSGTNHLYNHINQHQMKDFNMLATKWTVLLNIRSCKTIEQLYAAYRMIEGFERVYPNSYRESEVLRDAYISKQSEIFIPV